MSVEIHGAIVGGVLGALAAVVAVLVAEWIRRASDRRQIVEDATRHFVLANPYLVTAILIGRGGATDGAQSGDAQVRRSIIDANTELLRQLHEIRVNARWPMRRRGAIRDCVEDSEARLAALVVGHFLKGLVFDESLAAADPLAGAALHEAVFGARQAQDDRIAQYELDFQVPFPDLADADPGTGE